MLQCLHFRRYRNGDAESLLAVGSRSHVFHGLVNLRHRQVSKSTTSVILTIIPHTTDATDT